MGSSPSPHHVHHPPLPPSPSPSPSPSFFPAPPAPVPISATLTGGTGAANVVYTNPATVPTTGVVLLVQSQPQTQSQSQSPSQSHSSLSSSSGTITSGGGLGGVSQSTRELSSSGPLPSSPATPAASTSTTTTSTTTTTTGTGYANGSSSGNNASGTTGYGGIGTSGAAKNAVFVSGALPSKGAPISTSAILKALVMGGAGGMGVLTQIRPVSVSGSSTTTTTATALSSDNNDTASSTALPGSSVANSSAAVDVLEDDPDDVVDIVTKPVLSRQASIKFLLRSISGQGPLGDAKRFFIDNSITLLWCKDLHTHPVMVKISDDGKVVLTPPEGVPGETEYIRSDDMDVIPGQYNKIFDLVRMRDRLDCSFSLYSAMHSYHFVARTKEQCVSVVQTLTKLANASRPPLPDAYIFVEKFWRQATKTSNVMSFDETRKLLKEMNFKPTKKLLRRRLQEYFGDESPLGISKFCVLIYALMKRQEIEDIFNGLTKLSFLSLKDLIVFHSRDQQESGFNSADAALIMKQFGNVVEEDMPTPTPAPTSARTSASISQAPSAPHMELLLHGFESYLLSPKNQLMKPGHNTLHQDMTAPINHYTIAACEKLPSSDSYLILFRYSCARYIEVEVLDSDDPATAVPMTHFGRFQDFIGLVAHHAFTITQFPLILNLIIKCSAKHQLKAAEILENTLGTTLPPALWKTHPALRFLPSPHQLQNNILLMGDYDTTEKALGNLFFFHSHSFDSFQQMSKKKPWDTLVVTSKKAKKLEPSLLSEISRTCLTIVTYVKKKGPLATPKCNPCPFWSQGASIVSLDYFHFADVLNGMFMFNGLCGYIKKPWFCTRDASQFEEVTPTPSIETNIVTNLSVEILSARALPRMSRKSDHTATPHVELEVFGVPPDCKTQKTKPIRNNGFNPSWYKKQEPFTFPLAMSHFAVLQIRVMDGDEILAQYALPVNSIRPGNRIIRLSMPNGKGDLPPLCTLFVRVNLDINKAAKTPNRDILSSLPMSAIAIGESTPCVATVFSPDSDDFLPQTHTNILCAHSISTYPLDLETHQKMGSPICDYYCTHLFTDHTVFSLADGCNWGKAPRSAAKKSCLTFVKFVNEHITGQRHVKAIGSLLVDALIAANRSISSGLQLTEDPGTTTFIGGVVLPILSEESASRDDFQPSWSCILISLGDCKAFCYKQNQVLTEIAANNTFSRFSADASDPGGRLGPYIENSNPDLRNLYVTCFDVQPGDIIILVSDGVHDNLDAHSLNVEPGHVEPLLLEYSTWDQALKALPEVAQAARSKFMLTKMKEIIRPEAGVSCSSIVNNLLHHSHQITATSRDFMEQNPRKKLVQNYALYPGKLDHTTCVAFVVGPVSNGS